MLRRQIQGGGTSIRYTITGRKYKRVHRDGRSDTDGINTPGRPFIMSPKRSRQSNVLFLTKPCCSQCFAIPRKHSTRPTQQQRARSLRQPTRYVNHSPCQPHTPSRQTPTVASALDASGAFSPLSFGVAITVEGARILLFPCCFRVRGVSIVAVHDVELLLVAGLGVVGSRRPGR